MVRFSRLAIAALAIAAMAVLPGKAFSLEAAGVLKRASDAMGATDLRSLRYVGSGRVASFDEISRPGASRPTLGTKRYVRSINYETASFSQEITATPAGAQGGAAVPPNPQPGERRSSTFLSGPYAWDMEGTAANSAAAAAIAREHELWITPHGVIKAALRNNASLEWKVRGGKSLAAVSFVEAGRFSATVYINDKYLVERVESRLQVPQRGGALVVTDYSEYQSFGPIMFPMQIIQTAGGQVMLDIAVRETQPNAPINISVPESVRTAR